MKVSDKSFLRRLGIREAIGLSLAGMGPTLGMNLNPQEPSRHVGQLIPLVFLLSMFLVVLVAWCFARLSKLHPNAGSAFGFVSAVMGPRAGLLAGWAMLGAYLFFGMLGVSGFGLFRGDLAAKFHPAHHPSIFVFTLTGALLVGLLAVTAARRAAIILIILEGMAVIAMLILSAIVIWRVFQGMVPAGFGGDPSIRGLFIPSSAISPAAFALAISFGFLSFAGFEEVATMAEEVKQPTFTIPRVLLGTVIGGGLVFVLVTSAEVLGYGGNPAGMALFAKSDSLLGDLGRIYFWGWCGDLMDIFATFSALGAGLASVMGASRILFAIFREFFPTSRVARLSGQGSSPLLASLCVVAVVVGGYLVMRLLFHGTGSDPFFWASTLGVLALLISYLLVVISAGISLLRNSSAESRWKILIPTTAALAIGYTLFVNVYPMQKGAYGVIPWIVVGWCLLPVIWMMSCHTRRLL